MTPETQTRSAELADVHLFWPRTAIVDLIPLGGFLAGGLLYANPNDGTRKIKMDVDGVESVTELGHEYYPVLGRVIATYACREVKAGDVVRLTAMNYEDIEMADTRSFKIVAEKSMLAVIEGFDEASEFIAENLENVA